MFFDPPPSQGDLHFRCAGFPVRVHPYFWVLTVVLGIQGDPSPQGVLLWLVAMFSSILIHELGHAVAQRHYGGHPRIVLHGMGGLAICDDCERDTWPQVFISFAGPLAGFLFALALLVLVRTTGHGIGAIIFGSFPLKSGSIPEPDGVPLPGLILVWEQFSSPPVNDLLRQLFFINVLWGAVNLLPIYPLDGGRIARELLTLGQPRRGIELSLQLSIFSAAAMSVVGMFVWQSIFTTLFFGYLAYSSYQTLQAYRSHTW